MHDVMYDVIVCLLVHDVIHYIFISNIINFRDKFAAINMVKINVDKTDKIFFASGTPYCTKLKFSSNTRLSYYIERCQEYNIMTCACDLLIANATETDPGGGWGV